ncbi:FtsQ-type POTRA domain-containing protein [Candidatus Peregrinibacteria bacterium]|nr:FtsQ-type POTRA domain-containing protein [Candidatus Peregrinibacteria bacterium]
MKKIISDSLGKNLITIDLSIFETRILNKFPEIQEIDVSKNYPSSIEIDFKEYPMTANVILEGPTMKKNYIINSIGYAVKEDMENKSLPYIRLKSDEPLNTDTRMIEQSNLKYMLDSATYFQDKFGMRIVEIRYKKTAREIHLLTEKDFSIWLDIQRPFEDQLKKLKKALVKLDIYKENLSYIDLRIAGESGDKIIYKRK